MRDQLRRYVRWWHSGENSSTGQFFDIGGATGAALSRFERTGDPHSGSTDPSTAGNGSIMRLAPVPMYFATDPRRAIARAGESSCSTHGAPEAVDACRYLAGLIVGALGGLSKEELLAPMFSPVPGLWEEAPLSPRIAEVAAGSFERREPPAIRGSGYVVQSLEAALWALHKGSGFRDGALLAVNLGDDADTTGAVYGQLAGALYGESGIPEEWRARLTMRALIESLADRLAGETAPIERSFWVRPGLLAGLYPGDRDDREARKKLRALLTAGVTVFVDLTEEGELSPYQALLEAEAEELGLAVEHRRRPIRDVNVTTPEAMRGILNELDADLAAGRTAYLHCWGGVGRTGTVLGCHLVRGGATGDEALAEIARLRAHLPNAHRTAPETEAQEQMVRRWKG